MDVMQLYHRFHYGETGRTTSLTSHIHKKKCFFYEEYSKKVAS